MNERGDKYMKIWENDQTDPIRTNPIGTNTIL